MPFANLHELKHRITAAIHSIAPQMHELKHRITAAIHSIAPQTHELKHRITAAIHSVAPQMLVIHGVKSSTAWTYYSQPRNLTSTFINLYSALIS
ncbi:hypothetical protein AVEN_199702-1 [Araneus ventricosus]|uniref:Uncharacterized protein n=1 Tax=Araneus ventricosus TaxID=182803 RepID=A0A4Y2H1K4_ARAVE|nr:hypothetical protein AVEN_199702-1 [Araneus ventricosus]